MKEFYKNNESLFNVLSLFFLLIVISLILNSLGYLSRLGKYGAKENVSVNVFGINVIYPIANEVPCTDEILILDHVQTIERGGLLSTSYSYYLVFTNGSTQKIYGDSEILAAIKGKQYIAHYCDGYLMEVKEK